MKRLSKSVFQMGIVAATIVFLGRSADAQFDDVRASIEQKLVAQNVPSLAVAVAKDGKIIWEEGFGWADREKRITATEHTMYSLASISKPITATGLMVLVERGKVDLDRPINDYLGQAKLNGRAFDASKATLRLVANHTAGVPLHYQFFYEDEPYRRPEMDETIRRYANLVTPPGERSQYSNLGYGIIDYVIQRVSGKGYPDFMREEVFVPLGLTRMSVDIGPGLEDFTATRYAPDGRPIPFYDFDHPGGSAIFSSAHDLVRFGMFHLKNDLDDQRPILTDDSIEQMHRPTAIEPDGSGYGIGWSSGTTEKGLRALSHGGGMGGVSTTLRLLPEENAVVVVLCNSRGGLTGPIEQEILAVLAPEKTKAPDKTDAQGSAQDGNAVAVPERLRKRYLGSYDFGNTTASVYEQDGKLTIESTPGASPIIHQGDGVFVVAFVPSMQLKFEVEGNDTILTINDGKTVQRGSRQPTGPQFKPMPELIGVWTGEVSTYDGALSVTIAIRKSGEIYVQLHGRPWTVLDQANFSDGVLRGIFAGDIGTADANRRPYNIRLEVKKRGDVLNGSLIALSLPGRRVGNALSHWIEIRRK
jgi:CubicO group peptidase (beta-lactamase class C family)